MWRWRGGEFVYCSSVGKRGREKEGGGKEGAWEIKFIIISLVIYFALFVIIYFYHVPKKLRNEKKGKSSLVFYFSSLFMCNLFFYCSIIFLSCMERNKKEKRKSDFSFSFIFIMIRLFYFLYFLSKS